LLKLNALWWEKNAKKKEILNFTVISVSANLFLVGVGVLLYFSSNNGAGFLLFEGFFKIH
jgi:hypothetical protein